MESLIRIPNMPWRNETADEKGPLPHFTRYAEQTLSDVAVIASEKKANGSKKWVYLKTEEPMEKVVEFFGKPAGTPVQEHGEGADRLVAVWNGGPDGPVGEFDEPRW